MNQSRDGEWPALWVWRAPGRNADSARMAILTADQLFLTGGLSRRDIAEIHAVTRLGTEQIREMVMDGDADHQGEAIGRADITDVLWNRTTHMVEIGHDGVTTRLRCAESASAEELGRGLHREIAPSVMPESVELKRSSVVVFELTRGRGRVSLTVAAVAAVVAVAALIVAMGAIAAIAAAVCAVALVVVVSVVRDTDHRVPCYRVVVPARDPG